MGLITDALQIGRSALLAYQSALQVTGNNVSNSGSASYTRQTPVLTPVGGLRLPEGFMPGGGVALTALRRNLDSALENRIRVAIGNQAGVAVEQQTLGRIESIMNELSDADLSTLLQKFFNAFSNLQNQPHEHAARTIALTAGESLVAEIRRQRSEVLALRDELNRDLVAAAEEANQLLRDIAALNVRITALESSNRGGANSLRDERDALLRELGELMQIEVREQPDGGVNVYVGNELIIQGGYTRGITSSLETTSGQPRTVIRFADDQGEITIRGGRIGGMIVSRDEHVLGQLQGLNDLATTLIHEINKVHAQGHGLEGYTATTGFNDVLDPNAVLNSAQAGLQLRPKNGSFQITVRDLSSGATSTYTITVDLDGIGADDSLSSLVAQINAKVGNVTATITPDNRLSFTAQTGFEFTFGEDTSNVLAALGVNTLLVGSNAEDIAISSVLLNNPNLLAAGRNGAPGDGSNAAAIAELGSTPIATIGGRSLMEYYNGIANGLANRASAAVTSVKATEAITMALSAQRESISGVSLDEETIALLSLERSFQAAARYVSVVDQLIEEMLGLVR